MTEIGRLERVALREVWKHEAYDFTTWLENNVDIVNDVTGLNLADIQREQTVGAFSIDLVGEDEGGGKVIIENQLEKSNHDHLGKLVTYLSALNARAAIWIVSEPRPEHVAAMSWLNDSSSADFYLLKVEAVRIGTSPAAPLLTAIVKPSEDKPGIAIANQNFAERHSLRTAWWRLLLSNPEAYLHKHLSPKPTLYLETRWGVPGVRLTYILSQSDNGVELFLGRSDPIENTSMFDRLLQKKAEIEAAFGTALEWDRMEGKNGCRVRCTLPGGYRNPEDEWPAIQKQQVAAMQRLETTFKPHLGLLKGLLSNGGAGE